MRRNAIGGVVVMAAAACNSAPTYVPTSEILTSEARMTDDADLFNDNVIVNLQAFNRGTTAACSGLLLTRTRVLTASHCVIGSSPIDVPPRRPVSVGSVALRTMSGSSLVSLGLPFSPISELGHATDPDNDEDVGADLAILALDETALDEPLEQAFGRPIQPNYNPGPIIDASDWGSLLGTNIARPSFVAPASGAIALSSFGISLDRALRPLVAQLALDEESFFLTGTGAGAGDSGGSLFVTRSDGSRDAFGLVSGGDELGGAGFVNLTSARNSAWIVSHLVDSTRRGFEHQVWRERHPRASDAGSWWVGDDEYSGPCLNDVDADCDHWFDVHDNCPAIFNHNQADADDDGQGDACP